MELIDYSLLIKHIKILAKDQGQTQANLAKVLSIPESTLKKWFIAKDGPFSRIQTLCSALGLKFSDLVHQIEKEKLHSFVLTDKAQQLFLNDRRCFWVYWHLVYERHSRDEAQKQLNIEASQFEKILFRLDRINLITLQAEGSIKIPVLRPIRWSPQGRFMHEVYREWVQDLVKESIDEGYCSPNLILQYFHLSEESFAEFETDLRLLEEKYSRKTIQFLNRKKIEGNSLKLKKMRFLSTYAEGPLLKIKKVL